MGGTSEHPAVAAVAALTAAGVREFVICAGARNSALVAVVAAAPGWVRVWHHFEERSAAFFALGRVRAGGRPVAVCTTSGTAVAEVLPAVIEGHYGGLPLVVLSADRPRRYRGTGAPQAIEQAGIFQGYARAVDCEGEVPDLRGWNGEGPLQVNVCLEEPGAADWERLRAGGEKLVEGEWRERQVVERPEAGRLVVGRLVLAGDVRPGEEDEAAAVALMAGGAVWAEASSGLRDHPWLAGRVIEGGEAALRGWPVRQVVRVGGVPTCRFWRDLEDREEIEVVAVNRTGFSGLARGALTVREWREGMLGDLVEEDAERWLARGRAMRRKFLELCGRLPGSEPALVAGLAERIPRGSEVLTGNSLAVREWNLAAPVGMGHRVHALRGANGIDGNVSAFFGLASEVEEAWCLVGDLTALYDLAAPWVLPQMASGRRRVVVMNNGGGRIFSRLPGLRGMNERELGLMENPHAWGFRGWAEQWGMGWHGGDGAWLRGGGMGAVEEEHAVIELIPDAEETEAFWVAWVRETMEIGL